MSRLPKRLLLAGIAIATVAGIAWWGFGSVPLLHGAAAAPVPEDGAVTNGRYTNKYFDLSFKVPEGLIVGLAGPEPSETGYYTLISLVPPDEPRGTILIAAQDMFFEPKPNGGIAAAVGDFRNAMARIDGMTIDQEPSEKNIAGHLMQRLDFSGVGLFRATFVAEIRCHFVSFNLTARSPELLTDLVKSLSNLSSAVETAAAQSVPLCIKDYAVPENIMQRIEPAAVGPRFTSIPVRIVIDKEGSVKYIHVIHGSDEQRGSIEQALLRWKFKPPQVNGRAVEIETGLVFRITSQQKS
jgi:Gram-negative bacterial TonB protein C-terminal